MCFQYWIVFGNFIAINSVSCQQQQFCRLSYYYTRIQSFSTIRPSINNPLLMTQPQVSQNLPQSPPSIILQFYNTQTQSTVQKQFPLQILNFNIQLLNNNHNQPYTIPQEIVENEYPFEVIKQFLEIHNYDPKGFKVVKPLNSKQYREIVDQKTFKVCQKFLHRQNSQKAIQVVNLCRFLRFHQLQDAIHAAIAINYYVPPNDQKQLNNFKKKHQIDQLSCQEMCQIIKQYEQIFIMIEEKSKKQFLKHEQWQETS